MQARQVTWPQLVATLWPYVQSYKWGRDTLRDLWLMGAPVPQDQCPGGKPCKQYPYCNHIRRVLLPNQFAKWWKDVSDRAAADLGAEVVLNKFRG